MTEDLIVIGGGVMGLFTAYHASAHFRHVVVLERGRVGDPATASYGRTRSYRSDYLDPTYARLAREALRCWEEFEAATGRRVLVRCGCMNIAKRAVTPDLGATYGSLSAELQRQLGIPTEALTGPALAERFPQLDADIGHIDLEGGMVSLPAVTGALLHALAQRGVSVIEGVHTRRVSAHSGLIEVQTDLATWTTRSLVITAGHGTNDVLARTQGVSLQVPITRDRPIEARYYDPPPELRERFSAASMPVLAYLDVGVYCHPIVDGLSDRVKIGYYHPPDLPRSRSPIASVGDFVEHCLPGLRDARSELVSDVDGCDYDLVADDDFVLGALPGLPGAHVGVGWRGTGYKFAPWIGRVLAQLALQRGTVYDIGRFDPARFAKGVGDAAASVAPQSVSASL